MDSKEDLSEVACCKGEQKFKETCEVCNSEEWVCVECLETTLPQCSCCNLRMCVMCDNHCRCSATACVNCMRECSKCERFLCANCLDTYCPEYEKAYCSSCYCECEYCYGPDPDP